MIIFQNVLIVETIMIVNDNVGLLLLKNDMVSH